jgi:hypothetical protein
MRAAPAARGNTAMRPTVVVVLGGKLWLWLFEREGNGQTRAGICVSSTVPGLFVFWERVTGSWGRGVESQSSDHIADVPT